MIVSRCREPVCGEGSGTAAVFCSAKGCLKPTGQTTCMKAVARNTPTFTHSAAVLVYLKEKEQEWRFLVPVDVVWAACATHCILLSATAPSHPLISVGPSSTIEVHFKPNSNEDAWQIKENKAVGYTGQLILMDQTISCKARVSGAILDLDGQC